MEQLKINIGTEINISDLITSRLLIQANSGGGKSVLARVIMEAVYNKVPFIVMDIEGEYYTLKEKYGDILVIGGTHADVPISLKSVKLLPKEIIANRLSVVIDMSDMQMNDRIMYSKLFLETMMDLPKEYWVNYLVFLEEAHKLCGEQDKQASATAVKDLMSRGRKRGYCGILLTQRISKLHKDAAAECNNKFIGRTFLDIDLDRAAKELGLSSATDKNIIRNLLPGQFYAFGTSIVPHQVHTVKVNLPQTKIPKAGVNLDIKPQKPTAKILQLLTKLNELPAAEVKAKTVVATADNSKLEMEVKKLIEERNHLQQINNTMANQLQEQRKNHADIISIAQKLNGVLGKPFPEPAVMASFAKPVEVPKAATPLAINKIKNKSQGSTIVSGALRMLKAAAMFHPNSISKTRMGALARLSHTSGSFGTYLSKLRGEGLIVGEGNLFTITDAGLDATGNVEMLPTDSAELIELWCGVIGNQSGASRMLRELGRVFPVWVTKEELGSKVTMSHTSGSFGTYLSKLRKNALIEVNGNMVRAADELFN